MKKTLMSGALGGAVLLLAGCETPLPPGTEMGPHGTIAYDVLVEASPPGARIEANGSNLGTTPLHLKIFADRDGTFHDFGSYYYIIHAFPLSTNQFEQTRVFWTGRNGTHEDQVPKSLYFEMSQPAPAVGPNGLPPGYDPEPSYYPAYPYPYYGPYYYGPAFRVYVGPGYHHYHHR